MKIHEIKVQDKTPEYRFTGNLFNQFPDLLSYAPLNEKSRLNLILTPTQKSWIFEHEGKPFNFYPIFLKLTSIKAGKIEYCPGRKLDLFDIYKIQLSYENIQ